MNIAIVGSGISGLGCAHILAKNHDVSIFEQNSYLGGHINTYTVNDQDATYNIDTGFIVFNRHTYPKFCGLLAELEVAYQASNMGFSVYDPASDFYYNGESLSRLFAKKRNLLSPRFYAMLLGILRFNNACLKLLDNAADSDTSIGELLINAAIPKITIDNYVLPMISAIWSNNILVAEQIPASFVAKFFKNHGLLDVLNPIQWFTVTNGAKSYVDKIVSNKRIKYKTKAKVQSISREGNRPALQLNNEWLEFDKIIIATHSTQALKLLADPSLHETEILSAISYTPNEAILHTDTSILPANPNAWAAWNYKFSETQHTLATVTYNMNILQSLEASKTYLVTLNQRAEIAESQIIASFDYQHPVLNHKALQAAKRYDEINGINNTYYCGAYWGNGFHEDGMQSACRAVNALDRELLCKTQFI